MREISGLAPKPPILGALIPVPPGLGAREPIVSSVLSTQISFPTIPGKLL
jgi:hypothetical protein